MMPHAVHTLSEAEVISRWAELYAAGKHAGYAGPRAEQYLGRDSTWVEVDVPHDLYDADWNSFAGHLNGEGVGLSPKQMERAEEYARRAGPLPPGMAGFKGRRGATKIYVSDGNHRAYAAFLRGSPSARFYMPKNEWERFQRTLATPGVR
jgi:hypothetical protein